VRGLDRRERKFEMTLAAGFLVFAVALLFLLPDSRPLRPGIALAAVLALALTTQARFEVGAGYTMPTQLVVVPMLLLLPLPAVPLLLAAGLLLGSAPDYLSGKTHPARALLVLGNCWYVLGPVLVLAAAGLGDDPPRWADWPVYLVALTAQFALDASVFTLRLRLVFGARGRFEFEEAGWVYLVDALLAPIGLVAAFAGAQQDYAFLLVLPLCGLLWLFAQERHVRMRQALALSHAYRGTAMLLGDLVEDDDAYTGAHSRGVVGLALEVADELRLSPRERRDLEFAALLHDIGKVSIPKEIIHKAGPLTQEEMGLVRTHTTEGQRILARFGGLLGQVGRIVRACHERWDGGGYPDGTEGERIPLAARIIFCCDAFNAMTTDRVYRDARPVSEAVEELRVNAGTQFDPRVVEVLVRVLKRDPTGPGRPEPALPRDQALA
jgi:HD-GYP domain-containing protein (c-di-GMP phosphodiesterase class II)